VLRQRASPSVAINRNTHRIPVPPVGYRPDRPYLQCRHTPILRTLPPHQHPFAGLGTAARTALGQFDYSIMRHLARRARSHGDLAMKKSTGVGLHRRGVAIPLWCGGLSLPRATAPSTMTELCSGLAIVASPTVRSLAQPAPTSIAHHAGTLELCTTHVSIPRRGRCRRKTPTPCTRSAV
jgi:hypothetical protein